MKKIFFYITLFLAFGISLDAQTLQPQVLNTTNPQEKCGFDELHKKMMLTDPVYKQKTEDFNSLLHKGYQNNKAGGTIYRVPVVVHVMHKGEAVGTGSNISEAAINQGIRQVNERWRKVAGSLGDGAGVDLEIEFALAVRDPSGNCTNGIVRVDMSGDATYVANGLRSNTSGVTEATLRAASRWTPTAYYNIYLVSEIDNNDCGFGVQGYAYLAGAHGGTQDGMYQLGCKFAQTGNTTLTHELGHAWNLYHTFEGDGGGGTCPTGTGDFCADTPLHRRSSSDCVTAANPCDAGNSDLHIHNYMDYSSDACQSEFTADQETRASAAMVGTRASFLEVNGNMSLVPPAAAGVDFEASSYAVCLGTSVSFYDESTCVPNTYQNGAWTGITFLWTFDNGVNPAVTSTLQNPTINFANAGSYDVTLAVTTGAGTSTVTQNGFVNVAAGAPTAACIPTSTNEGNFGQTISLVQFNTISNGTSTSTNVAHTDYTCTQATSVELGSTYALTVTVNSGGSGAENFEVYIDYNNDATFTAGEMVMSGSAPNGGSNTVTQNILIPGTATIGSLLRMRVLAETGALPGSRCGNYLAGDIEDYGVFITSSIPQPPVANFSGTPNSSCTAPLTVVFTDLSTGAPAPTLWQWDIDNNGSIDYTTQNPSHTYTTAGTYTVALTATNANGSNTSTKVGYVTVGGGATLPIVEDFEGAFPPAGWTINNPDAARTWELNAASGNGGANAARLDFYNYNAPGQSDELVTNRIDISTFANSTLTFDVSYTPFGGTNDQLRVLLSTDCGVTFPTVLYDKMGATLQTTPETGGPALAPTAAGQWRNESVDLTPHVGNSIMLKFESTTQFGNNLFLDNINITGSGSLPVELMYFEAKAKNENVLLNWQTATEINNDYFVLERSLNGTDWNPLGKVSGAGNSNNLKSYDYIDTKPHFGTSYYRLMQVDFDGALSFSEVKAINVRKNIEVKTYPNPFYDNLNFDIYANEIGEVSVEVYNLLGSIVVTRRIFLDEGNNTIQTNFSELRQGSYIVKLSNGSTFQEHFKIT
ncbi:MAG: PKD domain-containing protein, partial [Vicingaceae bacterium]|nr:PKD domain-containing protein [Vicingaceae bacterium]